MATGTKPTKGWITTREAAEYKGVGVRVIQIAVARGDLVPVVAAKGRRPHLFRLSDVTAWVPRSERIRQRYTRDELLGLLREAARRLGHSPTKEELARLGPPYPAPSTFARRFGSWSDAKRLAGA